MFISLCLVGSPPPQEPPGEEALAPRQGFQARSFFLSCQASFLRPMSAQLRPYSEHSGSEASGGAPRLHTVLSSSPEACQAPHRAAGLEAPSLPCQSQSWCCGNPWPPEECPLSQSSRAGGGILKGWIP